MPTFERGDVVRVPFPYTDRDTRQHRPALVVSAGGVGDRGSLLWVLMVTSAENRPWPGDVSLARGYRRAGLPAPSLIRTTKIATIEASHADRIGKLDSRRLAEVEAALARHLGLRRTPDVIGE
jgi:mRNA interferase MazF